MNTPDYRIQLGDVTKVPSDLLLLKHAQAFYGAVPGPIRTQALDRLDAKLRGVVEEFEARYPAGRGN